jgi:hypothetical protein
MMSATSSWWVGRLDRLTTSTSSLCCNRRVGQDPRRREIDHVPERIRAVLERSRRVCARAMCVSLRRCESWCGRFNR